MKTALLSLFVVSALGLWAVGIYSADAASNHAVVDGYGVGAPRY